MFRVRYVETDGECLIVYGPCSIGRAMARATFLLTRDDVTHLHIRRTTDTLGSADYPMIRSITPPPENTRFRVDYTVYEDSNNFEPAETYTYAEILAKLADLLDDVHHVYKITVRRDSPARGDQL